MRDRIVRAAVDTLKTEGFAGTSARAIAARGGFSQAAIFYHFGTVPELLLAALDRTSQERMERYRAALDGVSDPAGLLEVARTIFEEDLAQGHITVLAEMISAASTLHWLGPRIVERIEPWIAFAREGLERGSGGSPFSGFVPLGDAAFAAVAFYLGVEMLCHLQGDASRAEALFDAAGRLLAVFGPLLGGGPGPGGAPGPDDGDGDRGGRPVGP
ncbi:MAG: TetR/AcrR family transcriptional regulator [Candidatus Velamenicoccus archaeovorus]